MELESTQRPAVSMHDVETQVSALGAGYALKPGRFSSLYRGLVIQPL